MNLPTTADLFRRRLRQHPLLAPAGLAAAAIASVAYVGQVDPNQPGHYPLCPLYALTGLYCPGCGGLRMVHALANGHLAEAVHRNVFLVALIPVAAYAYARWTLYRAGKLPRLKQPAPKVLWAFLAVAVVFTILRNHPMFHFLAPA